jgi:S-adenosylmethionine hydrolase
VVARVTWIDSFGNVVTNCGASVVRDVIARWAGAAIEGRPESFPLATSYEAVPPGALLAIPGSSGYLEISVREGSAADRLGLKAGDTLTLVESEET